MLAGSSLEALWTLVRSIPPGQVASYGQLGRLLPNPVSGLVVGRWMARAPEGIPWWRVVGADGRMPVGKRDPSLLLLQRRTLEQEGVQFEEDAVAMSRHRWEP
jgi:methylated-DNA-protein-cysteine methyltransferase-like protein